MEGTEQQTLVLEVNWVQGQDRLLFESFWSHVCQKLEGRLQDSELGKALNCRNGQRFIIFQGPRLAMKVRVRTRFRC
jgi:hypothetical protein